MTDMVTRTGRRSCITRSVKLGVITVVIVCGLLTLERLHSLADNMAYIDVDCEDGSCDQASAAAAVDAQHVMVDQRASTTVDPVSQIQPVLLLTYQRAGSSFLGQIINNNPGTLYWFEPGDGIYSHLYGTQGGWTVRDDVTNYKNGSARLQPQAELERVADVLYRMFTCQTHTLPVELLTHSFLSYFRAEQTQLARDYTPCMKRVSKTVKNSACRKLLGKACPGRFGKNLELSMKCFLMLNSTTDTVIVDASTNTTLHVDERVVQYQTCIDDMRVALQPCMDQLRSTCRNDTMVAMKTVRISMRVAELVKQRLPHLKIVHYMRDPRSITVSRMKHPSFRGLYSGNLKSKTARLYCQDTLDDVIVRDRILAKDPESVLEVYFEELAMFPTLTAHRIYEFLERPLPPEVKSWINENTKKTTRSRVSRDSHTVLTAWKQNVTDPELKEINELCHGLLDRVHMDWIT